MPRKYNPVDMVALPRMNAPSAVALAQLIEAVALEKEMQKRLKPYASVTEVVAEVTADREALQRELGIAGQAGSPRVVKQADRREDNAAGAIHDVLDGWARLAGEIPLGDVAKKLYDILFGDEGLAFTQLEVKQEWAVVDTKLKLIVAEKLGGDFESLGMTPLVEHMRKVHAAYGIAVGTTQVAEEDEPPRVREARETLLDSIRRYVLRAASIVNRTKPETAKLAVDLKKPVVEWRGLEVARGDGEGEDKPKGKPADVR